jgi:apolipoprotein N-acyltransferase
MQSARIFSTYSISFLIILTNMIIKECFFSEGTLSFRADRKTCSLIGILSLLHMLNIAWGGFSLGRAAPSAKTLNVTLIQPCFSVSRDRILQISQKALIKYPNTELLVWPEGLAGYALQDDPFRKALYEEINRKGVDLLMGGNYFNVFNRRDSMNIAFLLDKYGVNHGFYFKSRLFPFVERDYQATLTELENQTILSTSKNVKIGMVICLESLYPQYARERTQAGADVLGVLSTDTSFGNSAIPYIHMHLSALRAVENNKSIFHIGNSGPSAVFDNKGRKIIEIPFNKDDFQFAVVKI